MMEKKLPEWAAIDGIRLPSSLALEQCSSQETAQWKARLVGGEHLVDLTGGLGVDCAYLSKSFRKTDYVERQPALVEAARHNFGLLGLDINVHQAEAEAFLAQMPVCDCIFVDPARRDGMGRKVVSLRDCSPDIVGLHDQLLTHCRQLLLKLSPAHDIKEALRIFPECEDLYIIAVKGECKELLLKAGASGTGHPPRVHCCDREELYSFFLEDEALAQACYDLPKSYVYEPHSALLKAGAFKKICADFGCAKLHPNSHLYTSEQLIAGFPGRKFELLECLRANDRRLRALGKANLTVRNFPATVADLRKKWKLAEGGEDYLLATTLCDESHRILRCRKIQ